MTETEDVEGTTVTTAEEGGTAMMTAGHVMTVEMVIRLKTKMEPKQKGRTAGSKTTIVPTENAATIVKTGSHVTDKETATGRGQRLRGRMPRVNSRTMPPHAKTVPNTTIPVRAKETNREKRTGKDVPTTGNRNKAVNAETIRVAATDPTTAGKTNHVPSRMLPNQNRKTSRRPRLLKRKDFSPL
jgi:hypothetical protein